MNIPDQSKFFCVKELECENLFEIQKEVISWLEKNTNYLIEEIDDTFWQKINHLKLIKDCPNLIKFFKSMKIPVRELTVGVFTKSMAAQGFQLHIDALPLNFKINIPIFNTENIFTEWYDIPQTDLKNLGLIKNKFTNTSQFDLSKIHNDVQNMYPCICKHNLHAAPVIFNSLIPHRVIANKFANYPRIILSAMPVVDPINFMLK